MSRTDISKSKFYNELLPDEQKQYFDYDDRKYIPAIDNIYYSVRLKNDEAKNPNLQDLFSYLAWLKDMALANHKPMQLPFDEQLLVTIKSFKLYKYCLTCPDLFDIFLLETLPNEKTPRIFVQLRAYGLWVNGVDEMIFSSFEKIRQLFLYVGREAGVTFELGAVYESRIDYCYHTNNIFHPEKLFSDAQLQTHLKTTFTRYHMTGIIQKSETEGLYSELTRDYCAFGERKSNYVFVRFYNKAREVVELGYKAFFLKLWREQKLISFYDEFCYQKAYEKKNFNEIHKAKLWFYIQYGKNQDIKDQFRAALSNKNLRVPDYKKLADSYMPELTPVFNIEFETKRKFYYLSDKVIESLPFIPREFLDYDVFKPLRRLFRIIDNRKTFINYMSDNMIAFVEKDKGEDKFCDWWLRMRNTKLNYCLEINRELLRDYSNNINAKILDKKFINAVGRKSALMDSVETSFIEDVEIMLSNLNDNDKVEVSLNIKDGVSLEPWDYKDKKSAWHIEYQNRLKKEAAAAENETQPKKAQEKTGR